jgi:hypothetical protein
MKLLDLSETDYVFTRGSCAGEQWYEIKYLVIQCYLSEHEGSALRQVRGRIPHTNYE